MMVVIYLSDLNCQRKSGKGSCEEVQKDIITMAYEVIMLVRLHMPSYCLRTFTEYLCKMRENKL